MTGPVPIEVEAIDHSLFGASSATRGIACPGWINLAIKNDLLKGQKTSEAAAEGTAAHQLNELCLQSNSDPWEFIGTEIIVDSFTFTVDQEMADACQVFVDYANDLKDSGYDVEIEESLKSGKHKLARGTSDLVATILKGEAPEVEIGDYKHGVGITVEPDGDQLKYYAALVIENKNILRESPVSLAIIQPRIPHPEGVIRKCTGYTAGDILDWFDGTVVPKMEESEREDAVFQTGSHCRFCPVKEANLCPAINSEQAEFPLDEDPEVLDDNELGKRIQTAERIASQLESLKKEAFSRAMQGRKVSGYKLVNKKATRVWKEGAEEKLIEVYGDDAYTKSLLTPPQAEKMPKGKAFVSKNAYKPSTGYTLASEDDKRAEVKPAMEQFIESEQAG